MKNHARPRVKLVFCRGKAIVSLALLVVIVLSIPALLCLRGAIDAAEAREAENRAAAVRLEQENRELDQRIDQLGTADSVQQIAREELGLEDPDAIVFRKEAQ